MTVIRLYRVNLKLELSFTLRRTLSASHAFRLKSRKCFPKCTGGQCTNGKIKITGGRETATGRGELNHLGIIINGPFACRGRTDEGELEKRGNNRRERRRILLLMWRGLDNGVPNNLQQLSSQMHR